MSRISIDVSPEQHQKLKALAALKGKSIKDFVLESTLGSSEEDRALEELEGLLRDRLKQADSGDGSKRTVEEIFRQAREEAGLAPDA